MFSLLLYICVRVFMKEDLLGTWRRLLRVKKPCSSPSLLSSSVGNSGTLSLQDPDDMSLLVADSTSCGTKFSLLLSWVTSMLFPPSSIITSSLSLRHKKTRLRTPLCLLSSSLLLMNHKNTNTQRNSTRLHCSTLLCWAWTFVIWYTKTWGSVINK